MNDCSFLFKSLRQDFMLSARQAAKFSDIRQDK